MSKLTRTALLSALAAVAVTVSGCAWMPMFGGIAENQRSYNEYRMKHMYSKGHGFEASDNGDSESRESHGRGHGGHGGKGGYGGGKNGPSVAW